MEDKSKFWREIKALIVLLSSGAFVKVHSMFMDHSHELFGFHHLAKRIHYVFHFLIGLALQLLFLGLLVRFIGSVLGLPRSNTKKNIPENE